MPAPPPSVSPSLQEARRLATERQWRTLAERASQMDVELALEELELAYVCADAWYRVGDTLRSLALAERIEPLARQRGDTRLVRRTVNLIGAALFASGRLAEAQRRFDELLEGATEAGDEEFAARACNNLGMIANIRGQRDLALTCYGRALAAYQRLGYVRGLAQTHHNLGISYRDLGFDGEADTHYRRAIGFAHDTGSEDVVALAELERAMLRARSGDAAFAETLARRALQRFERLGDPLGRAEGLRVIAAAARTAGHDDDAARHLDEALDIARSHADSLLHAEVQRDRGILFRDLGDLAAAREALREAADHFATLGAAAEAEAVRAIEHQLDPRAE